MTPGRIDPIRTCVGCRQRAPRHTLLRVVLRDGQLVLDDHAVLPGRGAWIHVTAPCFEMAVSRRAFVRALRVSEQPDTSPLENRLETLMDN